MWIKSVTVRHYRIHRDLKVKFDKNRTVIGGPNESGKSTLVEAAHRALFLKAKITGEGRESMVSRQGSDHPEVEVEFEDEGKTYHLRKRFSGPSGTAQLSEAGGATWQDDEAESRLAEILGVEPASGGRGAAERSARQWSHLWVRQGQSGDDPTEAASSQTSNLLANLQSGGAAAVMQSDLDSRLARTFSDERAAIFTGAGKPRAGTDLARAESQLNEAEEEVRQATNKVAERHEAANQLREAERTIRETDAVLPGLEADQKRNKEARDKVTELQHRIGAEETTAKDAHDRLESLTKAHREIAENEQELSKKESALGPTRKRRDSLEQVKTGAANALKKARQEAEVAREATQQERRKERLARAWTSVFEREKARDLLQKQWAEVASLREDVEAARRELAALPPVTRKALDRLGKLTSEQREARVALECMATGVEVRQSSTAVELDGEELPPGERRVIDGESEIRIGDSTTIHIIPGGGTGLSAARERAKNTANALAEALEEAGVATLEEASTRHAERTQIEKKIEGIEARIEARHPAELEDRLKQAEAESEKAKSAISQRSQGLSNLPKPADLEAAKAMLADGEEALQKQEKREQEAGERRQAAEKTLERAERELATHQSSIEEDLEAVRDLKAKLGVLVKSNGDEKTRLSALADLAAKDKAAAAKLEGSRQELASLNPEQLKLDQERLKRAILKAQEDRRAAGNEAAAAKAMLHRDGTTDPEAAQALAEAALASARERHATAERHAGAILLLADLFSEEQRSLADEFTRPLAEKVSIYLQCLFGRDARATVTLKDQAFESLRLARPEGTFDFTDLSGGAREQAAAAFRLATAEILADNFGGTLPLVFDDAFTNSDPDRVQALQRMLDLAASRGLQIIVLTCNPADYSGLGAETIKITPPLMKS